MSDLSNILAKLNSYPGLKALVEAAGISTEALDRLALHSISSDRKGRMELSVLLGKTVQHRESGAKAVLRSELVVEFEKQGMSTENAFEVAEMFLELVQKEERNENRGKSPEDN